MANPQAEKEKNLIDEISNLSAFNPLNACDYHASCDEEHLIVSIQASCSREAAIKMGLLLVGLSALRNMPEPWWKVCFSCARDCDSRAQKYTEIAVCYARDLWRN